MSDTVERLEELKAGIESKIKGNRGHIVSLEDDISRWESEIKGLEMAIRVCAEDEQDEAPQTPALIGKYASMGLTDAIMDAVSIHGSPPGLTASELCKLLVAEGFKTKAKILYNSAYAVAAGLVEQERIKEGKKDGKRAFMRKQPF